MISEIIAPWLYLGSVLDAHGWEGDALCVHELLFPPMIKTSELRIPIAYLNVHPSRMVAQIHQLNVCAGILAAHALTKRKLLVHCMAGVERSPLTIVWYLTSTGLSLDEAYALVQRQRPQVEDRRAWLDPVDESAPIALPQIESP